MSGEEVVSTRTSVIPFTPRYVRECSEEEQEAYRSEPAVILRNGYASDPDDFYG